MSSESKPPDSEDIWEKVDRVLGELLDKAQTDDDKLKVIDRVLKKKAIEHKLKEGGFGSGFNEGD